MSHHTSATSRFLAGGNVVPVGDVEEFELHAASQDKPATEVEKRMQNGHATGKSSRGEKLTADKAMEFMIYERQKMDEEQAILRRENEQLRDALLRQQMSHMTVPPSPEAVPISSIVNTATNASPNGTKVSPTEVEEWRKEIDRVQQENMQLRLKFLENAKTINPMPSSSSSSGAIPRPPSIDTLAQRGPLTLGPPVARHPFDSIPRPMSSSSSSHMHPVDISSLPGVPELLWNGGYLWKIPFNGKGAPERRVVMVKKATHPGPDSVQVRINGQQGPMYISFPPTLLWYRGDTSGELGRELILYEDSRVMSGHSTPAFWKLANRNGKLPRHDLCFSVVAANRSLDCAAETLASATEWKDAMSLFLRSFFGAAKATGATQPQPPSVPPPSSHPAPPPAPPSIEEEEARKEIWKKQLFLAANAGDNNQLEDVLMSGIPVNLMEPGTGDTPLMIACRRGNAAGVRVCLRYGAKNDPHPEFGQTALHAGVDALQPEAVGVLLDAAAQSEASAIISNLADPQGQTPLHLAVCRGSPELVELLLNHGADVSRVDDNGQNVIHACCSMGSQACLAVLLDHGGDVLIDESDREGNTPLHLAAGAGRVACARLLLETAALVTVRNKKGFTPYQLATQGGYHQIGLLLLDYQDPLPPPPMQFTSPVKTSITATAGGGGGRERGGGYNNSNFSSGSAYTRGVSQPQAPPSPVAGGVVLSIAEEYPPSSQTARYGASTSMTPVTKQRSSSEALPRPHTFASPSASTSRSAFNSPVEVGTGNAFDGPQYSSPNYRVLARDSNSSYLAPSSSSSSSSLRPQSARLASDARATALNCSHPHSARERAAGNMFEGMTLNTSPITKEQGIRSSIGDPSLSPVHISYTQPLSPNPTGQFMNPNTIRIPRGTATHIAEEDVVPTAAEQYLQQQQRQLSLGSSLKGGSLTIETGTAGYSYTYNQEKEGGGDHHGQERSSSSAYYGYEGGALDECSDGALEAFFCCGLSWRAYLSEEGYTYFLDDTLAHSQWEDPREHGLVAPEAAVEAASETTYASSEAYPRVVSSPPKSPSPKNNHCRSPDRFSQTTASFFSDVTCDPKMSLDEKFKSVITTLHRDDKGQQEDSKESFERTMYGGNRGSALLATDAKDADTSFEEYNSPFQHKATDRGGDAKHHYSNFESKSYEDDDSSASPLVSDPVKVSFPPPNRLKPSLAIAAAGGSSSGEEGRLGQGPGIPEAMYSARPKMFMQPKKVAGSSLDREIVLDDFLNDSNDSLSPPPPTTIRDLSVNNSANYTLSTSLASAGAASDALVAYEKMLAFGCDLDKVVSKMMFDSIPADDIERFTKQHHYSRK